MHVNFLISHTFWSFSEPFLVFLLFNHTSNSLFYDLFLQRKNIWIDWLVMILRSISLCQQNVAPFFQWTRQCRALRWHHFTPASTIIQNFQSWYQLISNSVPSTDIEMISFIHFIDFPPVSVNIYEEKPLWGDTFWPAEGRKALMHWAAAAQ